MRKRRRKSDTAFSKCISVLQCLLKVRHIAVLSFYNMFCKGRDKFLHTNKIEMFTALLILL